LKAQTRVDEFAFILLAGIVMILILAISYSTIQQGPISGVLSTNNLQIAQGNSATIRLTLNGTGFNVTLSSDGEIVKWLTFDQNNFDLAGSKDIIVTVMVPNNANFRTYSGNVLILSADKTFKVPLKVNVGVATVVNVPNTIRLGDFTVSYSAGTETIGENDDFEISKGYLGETSVSFTAIVPDDKIGIITAGVLHLFVETSNSAGNLFVDFNGERVFANTISTGEILIPLNKTSINKYNSVIIRADNPGFQFWTNTYYKIKFAKMEINYSGISGKQITFSLEQKDLKDFDFGQLSFQISKYDPNALNPMFIQINGVTLLNDVPTLTYFQKTFGTEIPLYVGNNTISFAVSQHSYYQLSNVVLTIVHHI